jgi:hypothetical protein
VVVEKSRLLTFAIAADAEDLDDAEDDQEHGDPHAHADVVSPVFDGDGCRDQLEGEDGQPREGVIPANGKSPDKVVSGLASEGAGTGTTTYHEGSTKRTT